MNGVTWRLSIAACVLASAACGGGGGQPASPSGITSILTIRVYNSATGEVPQANFTVKANSSPALIRLADIRGVTGVDPQRAALRLAHSSDGVGTLAAKTTNGVISVPVNGDATYDLFLMSTASGATPPRRAWTGRRRSHRFSDAGAHDLGHDVDLPSRGRAR